MDGCKNRPDLDTALEAGPQNHLHLHRRREPSGGESVFADLVKYVSKLSATDGTRACKPRQVPSHLLQPSQAEMSIRFGSLEFQAPMSFGSRGLASTLESGLR